MLVKWDFLKDIWRSDTVWVRTRMPLQRLDQVMRPVNKQVVERARRRALDLLFAMDWAWYCNATRQVTAVHRDEAMGSCYYSLQWVLQFICDSAKLTHQPLPHDTSCAILVGQPRKVAAPS